VLRRFSPEQLAAILFALARTALCGYRAATQSFTVDESTTFLEYVRGPWERIYQNYDPNNHVLYSILAKLSIRAFRVSEFTLRLPSVLAGFFLVLGIYWVLETAVSSRMVRWVALVTLSLNPLLLDLSVAARGYGLGLAFLVWAIYFSMRGRDFAAGALLGLGVAANLTIAFPARGVIGCPLVLGAGNWEMRTRRVLTLAIPAAAIAAVICYPALSLAQGSQFYVGEPTIGAALFELIFTFIRASVNRLGLFGTGLGAHRIEYFFLPAVMIFIPAVSVRTFRRDPASRPALIPAVALLAVLIELVGAHYLAGLNYPVDRVGLYLFLLLGLAWATSAFQLPYLPMRAVHGALAGLLALQFVTQFETRYFQLWPPDLPAKEVVRRSREDSLGKAPNSLSLSATWYQQPALEFYRDYYRIAALKPVERHAKTQLEGFDYYVLNLKDDDDVRKGDRSRLVPLYSEPISGVLLAKEPTKELRQ
jgi:4-amino-4-deoxy-L-arabinose transferase-like glycosyltransferase